MPSLTGPQFWTVTVFTSMFAQLTSFTMLLSLQNSFASLHTTLFKTHVVSKSGDNIGLVWSKIYTSKKCQFEDVTILHCTNASHALGHPCLVSLLLWHPLLFHTFLIRRIFYLLVQTIIQANASPLCTVYGRATEGIGSRVCATESTLWCAVVLQTVWKLWFWWGKIKFSVLLLSLGRLNKIMFAETDLAQDCS